MSILKKLFSLIALLLAVFSAIAQVASKASVKILFIPLDDRPPCLQFTKQMGIIGDADVVTPPKELLGRFRSKLDLYTYLTV